MRVTLLEPGDAAWADALARAPHDVHHLPAYVALCARTTERGRPAAFRVDDAAGRSLLLPVVLRDVPGAPGRLDATSPHGYPGPLLGGASPGEPFLPAALEALVDDARRRGLVTLFVRLHPLLNAGWSALGGHGALVAHGETVVVDLALPEAEQWRQTESGHRNQIHRGARAGLRASFDASWRHLAGFGRLYRETMRRVGASAYYDLSDEYFADLRAALDGRLHLAVVEVDGALAAAGLFTRCGEVVQYHLAGMSADHARHRPTKTLVHHARLWAKAEGARWLHLGGGVGAAADRLFAFKAGFSHLRRTFETWRVVLDPTAYARLCAASGDPGGALAGFFPAYRRG